MSAEHRFDAARTVRALRLYALGLFKYIAVADVLNMVVDTVFPHYADYSAPMLILTAVMYHFLFVFQLFRLFRDFPVPPALCWGWTCRKTLRPRFTPPTFPASGAAGHISFSSWLQDYLFMPLAWADLGRFGRLPTELCVFCVFFASGFWHGSTAPFIIWGLLQAVYRVGEELLHRRFGKPKKRGTPARVLWGKRVVVFVLWTISMVFFRVGSGNPFRHGRKPGRWRCFRLPGPLPDEQLVPRPLCRGAVQHSVYRLLRQYHYGSGLLGVRCAGAGAWHLAGSPAQFCLQKQTG